MEKLFEFEPGGEEDEEHADEQGGDFGFELANLFDFDGAFEAEDESGDGDGDGEPDACSGPLSATPTPIPVATPTAAPTTAATATATPEPVGGIVELPQTGRTELETPASASDGWVVLTGIAAATVGAAMLGATAWLAQRRRRGSR